MLMVLATALTVYQMYNAITTPNPSLTNSRIDDFVAQHWATKHYGIVIDRGSPGAYDDYMVNNPSVIRIDDVYNMYYSARDAATKTWKIARATSYDGKTWTKVGPVITPSDLHAAGFTWVGEVSQPWVIRYGGTYYMYFMAAGGGHNPTIFIATSSDGATWTIPGTPTNPVLSPVSGTAEDSVWNPAVIYYGTTFYMYYLGSDHRVSPTVVRIFVATASAPEGAWTRLGTIAIQAATGEWDFGPRIMGVGAVVIDDVILLAYTAELSLAGYPTGTTIMGFAFSDDAVTFYRSLYNPILMRAGWWETRSIRDASLLYEGGRLMIYYGVNYGTGVPAICYAEAVQAPTDVRQIFIDRTIGPDASIVSDPICGEYQTVRLSFYADQPGKLWIEVWDEETQTWRRLRWYEYYESLYYTYEYLYNTPNELIIYTIEFVPVRMFRIVFFNEGGQTAKVSAWVNLC